MTNKSLQSLKSQLVQSSPVPLINSANITGWCFYISIVHFLYILYIGRGRQRSKPLHRSSDVERQATLSSSNSSMKSRLIGTPFMHLSLPHTLIKSTLDKVGQSSYESCLNMACSGTHVRLKNALYFLIFYNFCIQLRLSTRGGGAPDCCSI